MQVMEEMAGTEDFEDSEIPTFIAERGKLDEPALKILTRLLCHGHMPTRQRALEQLGAMAQQRADWTDIKLLSDLKDPDVAVQIQAGIALSYRLKTASDQIAPETLMLLQKMTQDENTAISLAARRALWFIERRRAELLPDAEWKEFEKRAGVVPLPEQPAFIK
jgi:HEAT repeat protein